MSFKTALASCWDVCKRNCKLRHENNFSNYFYPFIFTQRDNSFPKFNFKLYETYSVWTNKEIPFPYTEKFAKKEDVSQRSGYKYKYKAGLTEPEDKIFSSLLGWVFVIPEMLIWSAAALEKALVATFLFLMATTMIVGAPFFLLSKEMREGKYLGILKGVFSTLGYSIGFIIPALLRIPYHLVKAVIRIPVGVGIAVKEIVAPTPQREITSVTPPVGNLVPPHQAVVRLSRSQMSMEQLLEENRRLREENRWLREENNRLRQALGMPPYGGDNDFANAQTESLNSNSSPTIDVREEKEEKNLWQESVESLGATGLVPERYLCLISSCLMNPPFLVADGKFYNQSSIERYNNECGISPWTRQALNTYQLGIVLDNVQQEVISFTMALRAHYYLAKINGEDPAIRQKLILKIVENVSKAAENFCGNISPYIRDRHSTSKLEWDLAKDILNDQQLQQFSSKAIYTAFQHIQKITGIKGCLLTSEGTPPIYMMWLFLVAIRPLDDSYNNLIVTALQEAVIEERQISKEFYDSWQFEETVQCERFNNLADCIPEDKPDNFNEIIKAIQKNSAISIRALEYMLMLIGDPQHAGSFDQFQARSNNLVAVIHKFLEVYYDVDNEPFRTLFLITLNEIILAEQRLCQAQSFEANVTSVSFASVWREKSDAVMPAQAGIQLQNLQIVPKNQ